MTMYVVKAHVHVFTEAISRWGMLLPLVAAGSASSRTASAMLSGSNSLISTNIFHELSRDWWETACQGNIVAFSASGLFANTCCVVMMEVTFVGGRSVLGRCSTGAEEPTGASRGSELREEGMVPARVKNKGVECDRATGDYGREAITLMPLPPSTFEPRRTCCCCCLRGMPRSRALMPRRACHCVPLSLGIAKIPCI